MSYISILNHSSSSVCQMARGECVWRGSMKACPQYWHVVVYDFACVGVQVCVCERKRSRGSVWALAHTSICTVCLYRCVYGKHTVNTHLRVCATMACMSVCIQYVCVCMSVSKCADVSFSILYVHIISLTILLQYFYTSGRTVSCIIVSLNLEKSNVYLIVLFFVAEKTVQKMYNERYQTLIF